MERRVTSHTEEEEMNQRRRLLTLARKGDQKAVDQLFELYQVRVFSGDSLKRKKLPAFPVLRPQNVVPEGSYAPEKKEEKHRVKTIEGKRKRGKTAAPPGKISKKKPFRASAGKEQTVKGKLQKTRKVKKTVAQKLSRGKRGGIKKPKGGKTTLHKKRKASRKPAKKK